MMLQIPPGTRKAASKELNPSAVRKDIAAKVEAEAGELAKAVIEEGKKGQLATVKYLFEMAHTHFSRGAGRE